MFVTLHRASEANTTVSFHSPSWRNLVGHNICQRAGVGARELVRKRICFRKTEQDNEALAVRAGPVRCRPFSVLGPDPIRPHTSGACLAVHMTVPGLSYVEGWRGSGEHSSWTSGASVCICWKYSRFVDKESWHHYLSWGGRTGRREKENITLQSPVTPESLALPPCVWSVLEG